MTRSLKYTGTTVAMMEVPDEVSLAFEISDCPHRCPGCHSQHLWTYDGELLMDNYLKEIRRYYLPPIRRGITCVCFMGGEWRPRELILYARIAHRMRLKVCLYSGADNLSAIDGQLINHLDFLKIGGWKSEKGPLGSKRTNQKMFKLRDDEGRPVILDITNRFQKEYL